ncbi:MAG: adenylyltransferase/cytidyltransferase family protein, partial [Terriglobales bacterium]
MPDGMIFDHWQAFRLERDRLRRERRVLVWTNGCFDLLHPGHLRLLEQARTLGDCLLVAINTDASVRANKGPERPIIPEKERAEVLDALQF